MKQKKPSKLLIAFLILIGVTLALVAVVLGLYGPNHEKVMQHVDEFYASHWLLCIYIVLINIVTSLSLPLIKSKLCLVSGESEN